VPPCGAYTLRAVSGGFKRSSWFGVVGVVVVMGISATIALTLGSEPDDQKLALGLIFAVIAAYVLILFVLQARDLGDAEGRSAREAPHAPDEVSDPTKLSEPELWAALATEPIDDAALRARREVWAPARSSMRLGWLITPLIFPAVVPIYLFDTFVPLFVWAALIVALALIYLARTLMPGGTLDQGYERTDSAMAPLGLEVTERPRIRIEPRVAQPGMRSRLEGAVALSGKRHGRDVSVRFESGVVRPVSEVAIGAKTPEFALKARDGRLRSPDGTQESVTAVLAELPASTRWRGVSVEGGPDGIVVQRKGNAQGEWLCDLWLAERLAEAL